MRTFLSFFLIILVSGLVFFEGKNEARYSQCTVVFEDGHMESHTLDFSTLEFPNKACISDRNVRLCNVIQIKDLKPCQ